MMSNDLAMGGELFLKKDCDNLKQQQQQQQQQQHDIQVRDLEMKADQLLNVTGLGKLKATSQ
jgi:hypothetical protein